MSRPAKSLSDIWDIYLNYRMAPLPGAGAFMSAISPQGEILDVQDFFKKEFDQIINQVKADAWDEGYREGESDGLSLGHPLSTFSDQDRAENPYRQQEAANE